MSGAHAYTLGPHDELRIWALGIPEISEQPVLISADGFVDLAHLGRVLAAGLTVEELKTKLIGLFRDFVKEPDVSVSVVAFRSQPVTVIGAVRTPGIRPLQGPATLIDMISAAGGLSENAGSKIRITRRITAGRIPLPGATEDATGQLSVVDVKVRELIESSESVENIQIVAHDIISVSKAGVVYVLGQVKKPGEILLGEREFMPALEALSMAEGTASAAAAGRARILRKRIGSTERAEIPLNLNEIIAGRAKDIPLSADDILYVPASTGKRVAARVIEAGIATATGILIWQR